MKVIIVGGVAGGASCAARLRRLDEKAEILMVERGPYVSYANCGLPYHVGNVIEKESSLLVASEKTFREQFAVDCRTLCEAIKISPEQKTVDLRNASTGEVTTESYDKLVLSPGASSIRPPLPGIDLPGIFEVRTVPDARSIREWIERGSLFLSGMNSYSGFQTVRPKTRAVVVGGGFIGLETAENLVHRGFDVTLVEMGEQILAPLDREMALRRRALCRAARHPSGARRRGGRIPTIRERQSGGANPVRKGASGRPRDSRARRAPGHQRWPGPPGWRSASAGASASTTGCARATRTSSPSATPSK